MVQLINRDTMDYVDSDRDYAKMEVRIEKVLPKCYCAEQEN